MTPCLYPKCTNLERHNPDHLDFPIAAISNQESPQVRTIWDTSFGSGGNNQNVLIGIIREKDARENDLSGLM